jgi:hypothetical protein
MTRKAWAVLPLVASTERVQSVLTIAIQREAKMD